jgi:membrane protein
MKSVRMQAARRGSKGWVATLREISAEVLSDHATMTAAGLAFYSLLAIVPILIAISAFYSLVANPSAVKNLVESMRGFLPPQAADLVSSSLTNTNSLGLGFGLLVSLIFVLWTAQWAASGLITALNIVFDTAERRSFLRRQLAALTIAVGGIVLIVLAVLIVAVLPAVHSVLAKEIPDPILLSARWPLLAVLFTVGLSALYSGAPSRPVRNWRLLSWGSAIATVLWIGLSAAFSAYVSNVGSFNRDYGPLAGVAIFLFWLYLSGLAVILGAEIDAEIDAHRLGQNRQKSPTRRVLKQRERNLEANSKRAGS